MAKDSMYNTDCSPRRMSRLDTEVVVPPQKACVVYAARGTKLEHTGQQ